MAYSADRARTLVFKARRDTVLLVVAAAGVTLAVSSSIHSRAARSTTFPQQWMGALADVAPVEPPRPAEHPLTSASLVVPVTDLALAPVPARGHVRPGGCDGSTCPARIKASAPLPRVAAETPAVEVDAASRHRDPPRPSPKASLISRLNPLNHLPDMAMIGRPFAVAGDTMSGWFRRM